MQMERQFETVDGKARVIVMRHPIPTLGKAALFVIVVAACVLGVGVKITNGFGTPDTIYHVLTLVGLICSIVLHYGLKASLPDEIEFKSFDQAVGQIVQTKNILIINQTVFWMFIGLILLTVLS